MTAGLSGSYGVNGVNLILQPTEGEWIERDKHGVDAGAHTIYSAVRQFEMRFQLTPMSDLQQVINFYNSV